MMCGQYRSVISRGDNAASIPHIFVVRKPFSFIESYWAPKYGIDDPFIYQFKIPNKHTTTTLCKESLNSDGHPFYQIKKTNNHLNSRPRHVTLEIQFLPWYRHKNVAS